jgi:hypothetical protein
VRTATAIAVAASLLIAACGSRSQSAPARFTDAWPAKPRAYETVTDEWTRSGRVIRGYDKVLQVTATFMSPEWRAAYVAKRSNVELMGREERETLTAQQRAAAEELYEVELLVATYRYEENELQKGEKSMWRIVLVDGEGNEVRPVEIKRDRRPFEVIRAYFPKAKSFHTPYIARFPRTLSLLGEGSRKFSLKMASARGGVELVWTAR